MAVEHLLYTAPVDPFELQEVKELSSMVTDVAALHQRPPPSRVPSASIKHEANLQKRTDKEAVEMK